MSLWAQTKPNEPPYVSGDNDWQEQEAKYYKRQPNQAKKAKGKKIKKSDPRYKQGLREITKEGKYIYEFKPKEQSEFGRSDTRLKHGLIKITKDGKYIYKTTPLTKESKADYSISSSGRYVYKKPESSYKNKASSFKIGSLQFNNFTQGEVEFADTYSGAPLALFFDMDWQKPKKAGVFSYRFSAALITASGKGRFKNPSRNPTITDGPKEAFNFFAIPLTFGVGYRFQYSSQQFFVPYIDLGGTYFGMIESRDDSKSITAATPAATGAFGMNFNVTKSAWAQSFLQNYQGKAAWATIEFRQSIGFNEEYDISSSYALFGMVVDY